MNPAGRASVAAALVLTMLCGCQSFGGLLVNLGMVPGEKVAARHELGPGRLLILVDDDREYLTWTSAPDVLIDAIARNLAGAGVETPVVSSHDVRSLQQGDPGYQDRSIRELADRAGARQVLWVQVVDFFASSAIEQTRGASRCTVRLKLFDPHAETRARMRLWPETREGEYVSVAEGASVRHLSRTDEQIARALIEVLADKIAKMFYEHRKE